MASIGTMRDASGLHKGGGIISSIEENSDILISEGLGYW